MGVKVIRWDGTYISDELRQLPPGRYAVESVDDVPQLTEEGERGILAALDELDGGRGRPLSDVVREIRRELPRR